MIKENWSLCKYLINQNGLLNVEPLIRNYTTPHYVWYTKLSELACWSGKGLVIGVAHRIYKVGVLRFSKMRRAVGPRRRFLGRLRTTQRNLGPWETSTTTGDLINIGSTSENVCSLLFPLVPLNCTTGGKYHLNLARNLLLFCTTIYMSTFLPSSSDVEG